MAYTKTNWQDNVTPLSAANMNKIEQGIADAHTSIDNHIARTDNPHNTTAAQTGALVSVDGVSNPGGNVDLVAGANIAITPNNTNKTVTIAGTGTWPNADMVDGIHFRINNGMLEYNDGGTWKPVGFDPTSMTVNTINGYVGSISLSGSQSVDILSLSGAGVLGQLEIAVLGNDSDHVGISLIVDGVEKPLYSADGTTARTIAKTAYTNPTNSTTDATPCAIELITPIKYASSLVVRAKNLSTASSSTGWGFKGVYYT